jgi:hypothetical protein
MTATKNRMTNLKRKVKLVLEDQHREKNDQHEKIEVVLLVLLVGNHLLVENLLLVTDLQGR